MSNNKMSFSDCAQKILHQGRILGNGESYIDMVLRVANTLSVGGGDSFDLALKEKLIQLMVQKKIVFSTPILTNAGRYKEKTLTACTVPHGLDWKNINKIRKTIFTLHQEGMGTGFCLNEFEDPVNILDLLNNLAIESADSGKEDRPVGNMATLSVYHPKIQEFINFKKSNYKKKEWKFNLAINLDGKFLNHARYKRKYKLDDGTVLAADKILDEIVSSNLSCGDPGILFIDNLNKFNPGSFLGKYETVAPCGEVGLLPGESCQFGYLNLSEFVNDKKIRWQELEPAIRSLTRALDNALDVSIKNLTDSHSQRLMNAKRKIGVGICGLADLFVKFQTPYDSQKALKLSADLMSFINYISKDESHEIAKTKGSCGAMNNDKCGYYHSYIKNRFSTNPTDIVSKLMWLKLEKKIVCEKLLRNITTTALPPTGRSALIIDTSTGVEPLFTVLNFDGEIRADLKKELVRLNLYKKHYNKIIQSGSLKDLTIPRRLKKLYKTSNEIDLKWHIKVVARLQKHVDESISKTINFGEHSSKKEFKKSIFYSYSQGLKGISLYRSNSRKSQPKKLAGNN